MDRYFASPWHPIPRLPSRRNGVPVHISRYLGSLHNDILHRGTDCRTPIKRLIRHHLPTLLISKLNIILRLLFSASSICCSVSKPFTEDIYLASLERFQGQMSIPYLHRRQSNFQTPQDPLGENNGDGLAETAADLLARCVNKQSRREAYNSRYLDVGFRYDNRLDLAAQLLL